MGGAITCFLLEPVGEAEESLRRYVFSDREKCVNPPFSYHNAEVILGRVPWDEKSGGRGADDLDHADPRWPTTCGCGYAFQPDDQWQHNFTGLYARSDTGDRVTLSAAPPGAMWFADWLDGIKEYTDRSPDGRILILRTPGGEWNIDAKSSNGNGWTRTGTPPKVTANPSILCGQKPDGSWTYHGWLRDGQLLET